jgi:signal peptidase II
MAQTQPEQKKPPIYKDLTVLQLAALVFVIDQFSKYLAIELLAFGASFPSRGFFRFTHVHNTGSAFGLFQGQNTPLILVSFIGITVLALIYRSQPRPSNWLRLSLGLQMGGAFGNLVDRLRLGYVTDFIDVGPWPVFNLADASIVTGLLLLAWIFLRPGRSQESKPVPDAYSWCPVCEGDMIPVSDGWRCTTCGVKERIDPRGVIPPQREMPWPAETSRPLQDGHLQDKFDGEIPAPMEREGKNRHEEGVREASVSRPEDSNPAEPEHR